MTIKRHSDFNGDGLGDILFDNRSNDDFVDWQMSGLAIEKVQVLNDGNIPTTFGVVDSYADFNGDGVSDLLWHDPSTGQVAFWTMNGGTVTGISGVTIPKTFDVVDAHGDYNGDGKSDVLLRDWSDGSVSEFQMNGLSIAAVLALPNISPGGVIVSADSDYNGDGKSDVLYYFQGSYGLWLMNGTATPVVTNLGAVGPEWAIADTAGDSNGDGTNDIWLRNGSNGHVVEWVMKSGSISVAHDFGAVPSSLQIVDAHGDYNGDGNSDVLWRNASNGQIVIWTMVGGNIASVDTINGVPATNVIVDGDSDYNGDGKSDLLLRDSLNGNVTEIQMNGPNVLGAQILAQVPDYIRIASGGSEGEIIHVFPEQGYSGTSRDDTFHILSGGNNTFETGGGGSDQFVIHAMNLQTTITDFQPGTDRLLLDHTAFTALSPGVLATSQFSVNSVPANFTGIEDDHNVLRYYHNGAMAGSVATLSNGANIDHLDILII